MLNGEIELHSSITQDATEEGLIEEAIHCTNFGHTLEVKLTEAQTLINELKQ